MANMRDLDPSNPKFLKGEYAKAPDPATATQEQRDQYALDVAADFIELLQYNLQTAATSAENESKQQ